MDDQVDAIRVLITDDSSAMRLLLSSSLGEADGIQVVGRARDGKAALEFIDAHPVDVLIQVANRHREYVRMSEETRTLRAGLAQLQAEEKKVKARLKRHSKKDSEIAVAAERDRIWGQRYDVVKIATELRTFATKLERIAR